MRPHSMKNQTRHLVSMLGLNYTITILCLQYTPLHKKARPNRSSLLRIVGAAIVKILAPTPKIKPSACVNLGRSVFCRNHSDYIVLYRMIPDKI